MLAVLSIIYNEVDLTDVKWQLTVTVGSGAMILRSQDLLTMQNSVDVTNSSTTYHVTN